MKKIITWAAVVLVLLVAAGGAGFWWLMRQPLYTPGQLAAHERLDPIGSEAGRWQVADGIEISHFMRGEGRNVLFVHGGPGVPPTEPAPGFEQLADRYRFHYYDQRGTGNSSRPFRAVERGNSWQNIQALDGVLGIREQLADIERIRRLLGDDKLLIVGHSYGAFLAALYAAELPDKVEKLILIAPADLLVLPSATGGLFDAIRRRLPDTRHAAYDDWLNRYLDFSVVFERSESELHALDQEFFGYFEEAAGQIPRGSAPPPGHAGAWHVRAQFFSMGQQHDYRAGLGAVTAPALILHGGKDLQPRSVSDGYANALADARVETIDGAGHFPHHTHPEALAALIRDFLG